MSKQRSSTATVLYVNTSEGISQTQLNELTGLMKEEFEKVDDNDQAELKRLAANMALGADGADEAFCLKMELIWPVWPFPFPFPCAANSELSPQSVALGLIIIGIGVMML